VPIVGELEDGNASDKTLNHRLLSQVSRHLKAHGVEQDGFITIADSAMVTEANLTQAGDGTEFITLLQATYREYERVINSAIEAERWAEVGRIAQTPAPQNRLVASCRVHDDTVRLYGKTYRAAVVHSNSSGCLGIARHSRGTKKQRLSLTRLETSQSCSEHV
jgi:transposase